MSLETVLSSLAGVLGDDRLDLSFERDHLAGGRQVADAGLAAPWFRFELRPARSLWVRV
jgi:hypothetical protein